MDKISKRGGGEEEEGEGEGEGEERVQENIEASEEEDGRKVALEDEGECDGAMEDLLYELQ